MFNWFYFCLLGKKIFCDNPPSKGSTYMILDAQMLYKSLLNQSLLRICKAVWTESVLERRLIQTGSTVILETDKVRQKKITHTFCCERWVMFPMFVNTIILQLSSPDISTEKRIRCYLKTKLYSNFASIYRHNLDLQNLQLFIEIAWFWTGTITWWNKINKNLMQLFVK